jgi:hypothetical protein
MPEEIQENVEPINKQGLAPEEVISETSLPNMPIAPPKPRNNIFTLLLIISFVFLVIAIYLVAHELNKFYGVTFGGLLSEPQKVSEELEPGK